MTKGASNHFIGFWAVMHISKFGVIYWKKKQDSAVQNLRKLIPICTFHVCFKAMNDSIRDNRWLSLTSFESVMYALF